MRAGRRPGQVSLGPSPTAGVREAASGVSESAIPLAAGWRAELGVR